MINVQRSSYIHVTFHRIAVTEKAFSAVLVPMAYHAANVLDAYLDTANSMKFYDAF